MTQEYKVIRIECTGAASIPLDELEPFQDEIKGISDVNFGKAKRGILKNGFSEPISVWRNDGKNFVLNGHQRLKALHSLRDDGYAVDRIPCSYVEAKTVKEAKRKILGLGGQYGRIDESKLSQYINDYDLDANEIFAECSFLEVDDLKFLKDFGGDKNFDGDNDGRVEYTKKIEVPIYEPKGEKPKVNELYDSKKSQELTNQILDADLPQEVKDFLTIAATRHVVFNYEKIAEFYSHADKPTQELMERSALVIIDFDRAIEEGFVSLTKSLAAAL